jgi:hypothetical protein
MRIHNRDEYSIGKQPCNTFTPSLEANECAMWENEHECYKCGGDVSFCLNCSTDHHRNGYDTCKDKVDKKQIVETESQTEKAQKLICYVNSRNRVFI